MKGVVMFASVSMGAQGSCRPVARTLTMACLVMLLTLGLAACGPGKLSRNDAAKLIAEKLEKKITEKVGKELFGPFSPCSLSLYTRYPGHEQIVIVCSYPNLATYETRHREHGFDPALLAPVASQEVIIFGRMDNGEWLKGKSWLDFEKSGSVKINRAMKTNEGRENCPGAICDYIYIMFEEPSKPFAAFDWDTTSVTLTLGELDRVEVTGITEPQQGGGAKVCKAEYKAFYKATPVGQVLANFLVVNGASEFILYDDGWRMNR